MLRLFIRSLALGCLIGLIATGPLRAEIKAHPLFADHAVLQQGERTPIWGTGTDGEEVTVRLGSEYTAQTRVQNGRWRVDLQNLRAGGPYELTIAGPENTLTFKDILVGEVWICSGQSNMEWPVNASAEPEETRANANYPKMRLFVVPRTATPEPQTEVGGTWRLCSPETVGRFSAVGYAFGRNIHQARRVPVGLIQSAWGGTLAEAWTSPQGLEAADDPTIPALWQRYASSMPRRIAQYEQGLTEYEEALAKAKAAGEEPPANLRRPADPRKEQNQPSHLYHGMIAPLQPYAIRGVIWYQGESNAGRAHQYRTLFPVLIRDWRRAWGQGDFCFLAVQLAPWEGNMNRPLWPELREAQLLTMRSVPNYGMVVITDLGDKADIHPRQKEPVGQRLALAARALAYGEPIEWSGPIYERVELTDHRAILHFKHLGGGLVARDGPLQGFTICGPDRQFLPAQAEIVGDTVMVFHPDVKEPISVRYGWENFPVVNLWNRAGLPATPFRTDDFPLLTSPYEEKRRLGAAAVEGGPWQNASSGQPPRMARHAAHRKRRRARRFGVASSARLRRNAGLASTLRTGLTW